MKWRLWAILAWLILVTPPASAWTHGSGSGGVTTSITVNECQTGSSLSNVCAVARDPATLKAAYDVPEAGNYSGLAPGTGVECELIDSATSAQVVNWVAVNSLSASGSVWSGGIPKASVPQGSSSSKYQYTVCRPVNNRSVTGAQSVNKTGIGPVILFDGQSNSNKLFTTKGFLASPDPDVWYSNGNGWYLTNADITNGPDSGEGGGGAQAIAASLRTWAGTGVPIFLVDGAINGTGITTWLAPSGTSWVTLTNATNGICSAVLPCAFEKDFWLEGEQPDGDSTSPSPPTYWATDITSVIAQHVTLSAISSFKMVIGTIGTNIGSHTTNPTQAQVDTNWTALRGYQAVACTSQSYTYCVNSDYDLIHGNGSGNDLHFLSPKQYASLGYRIANAISNADGVATFPSLGPSIASAVWHVGSPTLTITLIQNSGGTALRNNCTSTGCGSACTSACVCPVALVVNSSGGETCTAVSFTATTITATMSANRTSGDGTITLAYAQGANPENWSTSSGGSSNPADIVYDNSSFGDVLGFPVSPTTSNITVSP